MNNTINGLGASVDAGALGKALNVEETVKQKSQKTIDLTEAKLRELNDPQLNKINESVARLRVITENEDGSIKTLGAGSGSIISPDGLILSVNHVPAMGNQSTNGHSLFRSGSENIQNLNTWNELLSNNKKVKLVADILISPNGPSLPETIFSPGEVESFNFANLFSNSGPATQYSPFSEGTIETVTVPIEIINEDANEDLMLARIKFEDFDDKVFSSVKVSSDEVLKGDEVFSLGHPLGIVHNALARGEVLDPSFDIERLKTSLNSHIHVGKSILETTASKIFQIPFFTRFSNKLVNAIDSNLYKDFFSGAIIATNNIDHGSSGGFLGNTNGELKGVTYIGLPKHLSLLRGYIANSLGLKSQSGQPIGHLTGSVGLKKIHRFLDKSGLDMNKVLDGKAVGVNELVDKAKKEQARSKLTTVLLAQGKSQNEIDETLKQLGLSANDDKQEQVSKKKLIGKILGEELESKLKEVTSIKFSKNKSEIKIQLNASFEDGEEKSFKLSLDPSSTSLEKLFDIDSKKILDDYLKNTEEGRIALESLSKIQEKIKAETQS